MSRKPFRLAVLTAALIGAAALGGCVSLLPKTKPADLYRFGVADQHPAPPSADARGVVLEPIDFPREATGDGILTVENHQMSYLAGARWVAPATLLFRQALDAAFDAQAPRTHLLGRGEVGRVSAILGVDVLRFEAHYDDPKAAPTVLVTLRARLAAADGSPIAAMPFEVAEPAADNRVSAIVAAYNRASIKALSGLAAWVDQTTPEAPRTASTSTTTSTKTSQTSTTTTRQP